MVREPISIPANAFVICFYLAKLFDKRFNACLELADIFHAVVGFYAQENPFSQVFMSGSVRMDYRGCQGQQQAR